LKVAGAEQLKAFVVSGNGKGHCIEVHASRVGATEQQRKEWLRVKACALKCNTRG